MGCCDHIFILRQILEHHLIHQQEKTQVFIDFVTAFDLVKRNTIWDTMRDDGVPEKIVCLVKACYVGTRAFVRADGEISKEVPIDEGVQQGCQTLSIIDFDSADDVDILDSS